MQTTQVVIRAPGPASSLSVESCTVGEPGPGQVLLEHTAIGVNFIDTYHRSGLYPLPHMPHPLGVEAAGVVRALGPDVTELVVGQRVAYASGALGAYAKHRLQDAARCVPLPDDVNDETAARVLLKGMTVHMLIRRVHPVQRGEFVLWHAAAGGVGLLACQWLASLGARVIGTVGSDAKAALAESQGCEFPIVYTRQSFPERVVEITAGKLVPVAYDSVGKDTVPDSLRCLAPRGLLVSFGNASGKPPAIDLGLLAERGSLFVTRPKLADYIAARPELLDAAGAVFEALRKGHIRPHAGPTFALTDAQQAHEALGSRKTTGALLLIP